MISSLIVELDTANNAASDNDGNHIAVHFDGDSEIASASGTPGFDLEDGNTHRVWVDYSDVTGTLSVYAAADPLATKPGSPVVSVSSLDLPAIVGSLGYFGFTAGTGSQVNNHYLESWVLSVDTGDEPRRISEGLGKTSLTGG